MAGLLEALGAELNHPNTNGHAGNQYRPSAAFTITLCDQQRCWKFGQACHHPCARRFSEEFNDKSDLKSCLDRVLDVQQARIVFWQDAQLSALASQFGGLRDDDSLTPYRFLLVIGEGVVDQ